MCGIAPTRTVDYVVVGPWVHRKRERIDRHQPKARGLDDLQHERIARTCGVTRLDLTQVGLADPKPRRDNAFKVALARRTIVRALELAWGQS